MSKTSSQLDAEIAAGLAKPRKARKAKNAPETKQEELARLVEASKTRLRAIHGHGLPGSDEEIHTLNVARVKLARQIAMDLGHNPTNQGISSECYRCGASGTFDVGPIGDIFTRKCGA